MNTNHNTCPASTLIEDLRGSGITIRAPDNRTLVVTAPGETAESDVEQLRDLLVRRKAEVLRELCGHKTYGHDSLARPLIEYSFRQAPNTWMLLLGAPGESVGHAIRDLRRTYGGRLSALHVHKSRAPRHGSSGGER